MVRTRAGQLAQREIQQRDAIYREYHEKLRRADGWYCFVIYRPHGRSGCTIVKDRMCKALSLPLLRWHGGGDHHGTEQAKIAINDIF